MSMQVRVWEPFKNYVTLREAMDRLFEDSLVRPRNWPVSGRREQLYLPVDAYTTDEEVVVVAALPGVKPEDVEITFEADTLTIKGKIEPTMQHANFAVHELAYGPFSRSLTINVPVDADKAEAVFENGLLTLRIPKAEQIRPKQIKVKPA